VQVNDSHGFQILIRPRSTLSNYQNTRTWGICSRFSYFPGGQEVWEKLNGQTSALIPGTTAYKYAQGKPLLQMKQHQAEIVDKLARQYGKILGFETAVRTRARFWLLPSI
jgi:hypothetical protein